MDRSEIWPRFIPRMGSHRISKIPSRFSFAADAHSRIHCRNGVGASPRRRRVNGTAPRRDDQRRAGRVVSIPPNRIFLHEPGRGSRLYKRRPGPRSGFRTGIVIGVARSGLFTIPLSARCELWKDSIQQRRFFSQKQSSSVLSRRRCVSGTSHWNENAIHVSSSGVFPDQALQLILAADARMRHERVCYRRSVQPPFFSDRQCIGMVM